MEWQFRNDSPIYTQLTQRLTQRALADLERDGLVFSQRTAGRFVTGDVSMIENAKLRLADQCVENFLSEMAKLGCGRDEVIALLQGRKEEEP